jgi:hypothetical protein
MIRSSRWSLVFVAAVLLPPTLARADDPPIRLKLSDEVFAPGDRVKVRVKLAADGYLVVLRADAQGRVRVLFPVDPTDSGSVRGGREFSVRGRGDREGFLVDDREGSGVVLAARSDVPFDFQAFTRAGHWDYRALAASDSAPDGETALLDLIDRMAAGDYDFDVLPYAVTGRVAGRRYVGWPGRVWPCWGCRPWFGPMWYQPWYGSRIWIGGTLVIGRRHVGHRWH